MDSVEWVPWDILILLWSYTGDHVIFGAHTMDDGGGRARCNREWQSRALCSGMASATRGEMRGCNTLCCRASSSIVVDDCNVKIWMCCGGSGRMWCQRTENNGCEREWRMRECVYVGNDCHVPWDSSRSHSIRQSKQQKKRKKKKVPNNSIFLLPPICSTH